MCSDKKFASTLQMFMDTDTWSYKLSLVFLLMLWIPFSYQQDFGTLCSTPRNEIGTCISIRQCPVLYDLLNDRSNSQAAQYVQTSTCGFDQRLPKVCCPQKTLSTSTTTTSRPRINNPEATTRRDSMSTKVQESTTKRSNNRIGPLSKFPSPENKECGVAAKPTSRIVGGVPSEIGQWPWMTAIGYKQRGRRVTRKPDWSCGGSLITARYVLTAAHCVSRATTGQYEPYVVHVGGIDLDQDEGDRIEIEQSIVHEQYSPTTKLNDIAMFRLKREAKLSPNIQPACLPFDDEYRTELFEQKMPFIAGWGSTDFQGPKSTKLRHVQISVVDNPVCKNIFASFGAIINDNIICAGVLAGGKDSCGGDSGGPLVLPIKTQYYVIGVVSYGKKCAEPGFPGVYTRVTNYIQWISDNIS